MTDGTQKYELTDEHRAQLGPWRDRWIANAMSTKHMDADDRRAMHRAINGLYDAANLPRPTDIVFVPSPFVLRFAGGFAAALWWLHKNGKLPPHVWQRMKDCLEKGSSFDHPVAAAIEVATFAAFRAALHAAEGGVVDQAVTVVTGRPGAPVMTIGGAA